MALLVEPNDDPCNKWGSSNKPKELSIKGGPYNTNNSNPMGENIINIWCNSFLGCVKLQQLWEHNTLSFLWMPTLATLNIFLFMDANFGNMKHYHFYGCQFWEQKMLSILWMPGRRPDASVVLKLCIGRREMRGEGDYKCVGLWNHA